jgi:hypothetical protein
MEPASSACSDPFLLDFGTSVNVNEDLRRSIRAEIQELEDNVVALKGSAKSEERTQAHLKQDLVHAHTEMSNLSRGAADQLDNAGVHSSIVQRLEESLNVELVQSTGVRSSSSEGVVDRNGTGASPAAGAPCKNSDIIKETTETMKTIGSSIREASESVDRAVANKKVLEDATQSIYNVVAAEKLPTVLETATGEMETRKKDTETKEQRQRAMKAAIQQTRTRCGTHAQKVADNVRTFLRLLLKCFPLAHSHHSAFFLVISQTKDLNLLKREHAPQETSLQKDVLDAEEEAQQFRASSKSKAELSTVSTQLDQLEQQIREIVEICKAREQKKLERTKIYEEAKALASEKQELEVKVASARAKRDAANKALEDAQALEAATCEAKQANDMLEVSRVVPGRTERVELAVEKEKLARIIGTLHENTTIEQSRFKAEEKENAAILNSLQEELARVKEDSEGKESKLGHFIRIRDESKETWEREIKEHESLGHKYQLANEAERARAEDISKERKKRCDERLEIAKSKASERERYLQVLVYGTELLDNTRDAERKLLEDPIET